MKQKNAHLLVELDNNLLLFEQKNIEGRGAVYAVDAIVRDGKFITPSLDDIPPDLIVRYQKIIDHIKKHAEVLDKTSIQEVWRIAQDYNGKEALDLMLYAQLWASFLKASFVYETIADNYFKKPSIERFSPDLAIELYRQIYERFDLQRCKKVLEEDVPNINYDKLNAVQKECIHDALYHINIRVARPEQALRHILNSWRLDKSDNRTEIILELATQLDHHEVVSEMYDHKKQCNLALVIDDHARAVSAYSRLEQQEETQNAMTALEKTAGPEHQDMLKALRAHIQNVFGC